jgi:hypothetical protein
MMTTVTQQITNTPNSGSLSLEIINKDAVFPKSTQLPIKWGDRSRVYVLTSTG